MGQPPQPARVITRVSDGCIRAYRLSPGALGELAPAATFPLRPGDEVAGHTAAVDLRRAFYTTLNEVVCVAGEGGGAWRTSLDPFSAKRYGHRPGCVLSPDGTLLWVYRPDAMAGRGQIDHWAVLDARTGAVLAQAGMETSGHAGVQFPHPTDGHVLLEVGEGQDGVLIFRGRMSGSRLSVDSYPWYDRCLIDLGPGGDQFMTVDHDQGDVAFHAYPSGDIMLTVSVDAFGHNPDQASMAWNGGYLTGDTAIVTIVGETADEQEWVRHYLIDIPAGRAGAELPASAKDQYDLRPLGDGTWLTTAPSGHPIRWPAQTSD